VSLASLLYEVRPGDPLTIASVAALLVSIVLLCCGGAAWRATRIDPMTTLRCE